MLNKVLFVSFKFMNQILILYVNFYYKVKYRELAQSDIRTAIYKFLHKVVFYWRRYTSLNMHVSVELSKMQPHIKGVNCTLAEICICIF